jgi:hypothetical protein
MNVFRLFVLIFTPILSFSVIAQTQGPVGFKYDLIASNPLAVVAAIDKYRSSDSGSNDDVSVTLHQYLANGTNPATHAITVSYASPQVMDAALSAQANSPTWAVFQSEMSLSAEIVSSMMWRSLGLSGGNTDVPDSPMASGNWIFMKVDDPAAYAEAWQSMVDSQADEDRLSTLLAIPADGAGGATHAVINTARSPGSQFAPQNDQAAFARFREEVSEIREITERVRLVKVKSW